MVSICGSTCRLTFINVLYDGNQCIESTDCPTRQLKLEFPFACYVLLCNKTQIPVCGEVPHSSFLLPTHLSTYSKCLWWLAWIACHFLPIRLTFCQTCCSYTVKLFCKLRLLCFVQDPQQSRKTFWEIHTHNRSHWCWLWIISCPSRVEFVLMSHGNPDVMG